MVGNLLNNGESIILFTKPKTHRSTPLQPTKTGESPKRKSRAKIQSGAAKKVTGADLGLPDLHEDESFRGLPPPVAELEEEAPPAVDPLEDPKFNKYKMMQRINLPEGAIRQKMENDNLCTPDEIDLFCPNTVVEKFDDDEGSLEGSDYEAMEEEGEHEIVYEVDAPDGEPKDWEETPDPNNPGSFYYVNRITWESSWVPPVGWKAYQEEKEKNKGPMLGNELQSAIMKGRNLKRVSVLDTKKKKFNDGGRMDIMESIKQGGIGLKKAAPLPPKPVDARTDMLSKIKNATLKKALVHVERKEYDGGARMDDAVAQLLANRTAIAGDDDSDSDSDYDFDSDDDYP